MWLWRTMSLLPPAISTPTPIGTGVIDLTSDLGPYTSKLLSCTLLCSYTVESWGKPGCPPA